MNTIPVFYSDDLLAHDSLSPSAAKPRPVVERWKEVNLPIVVSPVTAAAIDDLSLAHDPRFVAAILLGEVENGFRNCDLDVARSLPYTTGAMICAATAALRFGVACAPVGGFHHAGYATAEMFCTFNGLMVAALKLLRGNAVRHVLILDLDFHYGNGTDDIIERLQLRDQIENATFGRWYRSAAHAARYLGHLAEVTATFSQFDLILYQAGADLHVDDPLGGVLDSVQLRQRDAMVFSAASRAGVPLAWNLAGGYQDPISKVIEIHCATMEECVRAYVGKSPDLLRESTAVSDKVVELFTDGRIMDRVHEAAASDVLTDLLVEIAGKAPVGNSGSGGKDD
jgi:acetoin utilization deacetylase AcuC-like enzyme